MTVRRFLIRLLLAILLVTATGTLWKNRFEHAGPPLSAPFQPGLPGWTWIDGKGRENNPDASGALVLSKQNTDPAISVERSLGKLDGVRFLHLQTETRWTDVKQLGEIRWANARGLIYGKKPDGSSIWPKDHWLISAHGSREWHLEESVFDLMPDIGEAHFTFQNLGEHGTLEVRNLEINVVRQRGWYLPTAWFLTALWSFWAAWSIAPALPRSLWLRPIRSLLSGAVVIAASWFLIFPQPRFSARPLFGRFELGQPLLPSPPPPPQPIPELPPLTTPSTPAALAPLPLTPLTPPILEKREDHAIEQEVRFIHDDTNFSHALSHILAFLAFGLSLFFFATPRAWPISVIVTAFSEIVPNWLYQQPWDLGDIGDFAADFSGLALAALAVTLISRLRRKCFSRSNISEISASLAPP
jgi:hypothetical protein